MSVGTGCEIGPLWRSGMFVEAVRDTRSPLWRSGMFVAAVSDVRTPPYRRSSNLSTKTL